MFKLAVVIFVLAAPVLMGIFTTALLTVQQFSTDGSLFIWAAVAGLVTAIPVSRLVAKKPYAATRPA